MSLSALLCMILVWGAVSCWTGWCFVRLMKRQR